MMSKIWDAKAQYFFITNVCFAQKTPKRSWIYLENHIYEKKIQYTFR
jgi:hypothetical protein